MCVGVALDRAPLDEAKVPFARLRLVMKPLTDARTSVRLRFRAAVSREAIACWLSLPETQNG